MFTYCTTCSKRHDSPVTICSICKQSWNEKRALQAQRRLEINQRINYLTNSVYAPSHVELSHDRL